MTTRFDRLGKLVRRGGRSPVVSGGVAPTITTPPVLAWTVEIGNTPTLTDPVYTGDTGTITWTLYRDGVADGTIAGVSKATAEAYAAQWSGTNTGVNDIGRDGGPVQLTFYATVTNGSGSDSAESNAVSYDDTIDMLAGWHADEGLTLVLDSGSYYVDEWASCEGAVSATVTAPSSSARPLYDATGGAGGRPLIVGDGVDDRLSDVAYSYAPSAIEFGVVAHSYSTAGNNNRFISRGGGATSAFINQQIVGTVRVGAPSGRITALVSPAGAQHFSGDSDGSTATNLRFNGAIAATTLADAVSLSNRLDLFGYPSTGYYANGGVQAVYFGAKLTDARRLNRRAYLTGRTGVAC